jgi:SAM-dependent methyltransferase
MRSATRSNPGRRCARLTAPCAAATVVSTNETHFPECESWLPQWDGAAYAANTGHHRANDAWFLERFPARPGDRLLDVGCGSGDFTRIVAGLVPQGHVIGVDPQPSMLDEARAAAAPNQSFVHGTAQRLTSALPPGASFDAVYTRATLQWVPWGEHPAVVGQLAAVTRPGGWVRVEMGGHGNIGRIVEVIEAISIAHGGGQAPWSFPDAAAYLDLFERAGLDATPGAARGAGQPGGYVHTVAQRRPFTRESLLGWLASQCVEAFRAGLPVDAFDSFAAETFAAVDRLRRADGSYDQTFVRLDALAYRPA